MLVLTFLNSFPDDSNDEGDNPVNCPLCQEKFEHQSEMENHAMSVHSVNQEGLQRLQSLINGSHWLNQNQHSKQRSKSRDDLDDEDERRKTSHGNEGKQAHILNSVVCFDKYYMTNH